jgi:LmbE family N-acetylglucosaminyl deacetylase
MEISVYKNVLVLAPHTDDGELGAGGTINKLNSSGSKVTYVAFSTAKESVPAGLPSDILKSEVREATSVLGVQEDNLIIYDYQVRRLNYSRQEILENLIELRRKNHYDLVLIPSLSDIHQDHSTIAAEAVRAFKGTSIWSYELLWNNLDFKTQCFVKLDPKHLDKKIEALKKYKSQGSRPYLSADFIKSLAVARGVQVGVKYAEVFEVVRLINN